MNPAAIEGTLRLVLLQWGVIILIAQIGGRLGRRWGQPLVVGEILAGILLGPSALGAWWPAGFAALFPPGGQTVIQILGKLGVILLLFQVGMEFDYGHLRSRSHAVLSISLMGLVAPIVAGLAIGPWLHRSFAPELDRLGFLMFVCIALSISALPVMGRILLELRLERSALGVLAISAAALDDVVGWILLGVATALVTSGLDGGRLAVQCLGLVLLFVILHWLVGPWLRHFWRRDRGSGNSLAPQVFALLLIALFASSLATNRLGVFSLFGAFILGTALHQERELVEAWRQRMQDVVSVALVPIFFTNTGLHTEIGSLHGAGWLGAGLVLLTAVAGKLGGCYVGARFTGQSSRESACVAVLMNARGLMGLVAINVGLELGLLNRTLFTMLVLMALLTTAMTGPLLGRWLAAEPRNAPAQGSRAS